MEKKKAKFNGMDLFIIIVIATVIAAGAYIFLGRDSGAVSYEQKSVEVTTTVELAAKDKEFADIIKKGDVVAIGEKEKAMAEVADVILLPAKTNGYDIIEGRVLRSEVPDKYDINVVLVSDGTERSDSIEIDGSAMRVGQDAVLSSKNWAGHGYIVGLEISEKD